MVPDFRALSLGLGGHRCSPVISLGNGKYGSVCYLGEVPGVNECLNKQDGFCKENMPELIASGKNYN